MALFYLLLGLRSEIPFGLFLAHFNHGLRPEADEEENFVRETAGRHGVEIFAEKSDVAGYAASSRLGLEEAGRRLRYQFLYRAAVRAGAGRIATGHSLNDQAETVLMRIMRGTGLTGLAGIAPVAEYEDRKIIRPLINISRDEIERYLQEGGYAFRTDNSNLDRRFLRNRVRHELIPELERHFGGNIAGHLARLAGLVREEEQILTELIQSVSSTMISGRGKEAALDAGLLSLLPLPVARRVIREFLKEIKGDLAGFSLDDVDRISSLEEGKETPVSGGFLFRREKQQIFLKKKKAARPGFGLEWDGNGEVRIGETGFVFRGTRISDPGKVEFKFDDKRRAFFDLDRLSFPISIRNAHPGDKYRPLGSPGRKKVNEMMRVRGVPVEERNGMPVFLCQGEIAWVPGLPVADGFKISQDTKTVFMVERSGA